MALPSTLLIIFSSAALVFGHLYPAIETTSDIFQTQVPFSEKYSQAQKKKQIKDTLLDRGRVFCH